jgi:hypothetical protein
VTSDTLPPLQSKVFSAHPTKPIFMRFGGTTWTCRNRHIYSHVTTQKPRQLPSSGTNPDAWVDGCALNIRSPLYLKFNRTVTWTDSWQCLFPTPKPFEVFQSFLVSSTSTFRWARNYYYALTSLHVNAWICDFGQRCSVWYCFWDRWLHHVSPLPFSIFWSLDEILHFSSGDHSWAMN